MKRKYAAESGYVRAVGDLVKWVMSADEAEEIADFIERASVPYDAARVDVKALRSAVADARGEE